MLKKSFGESLFVGVEEFVDVLTKMFSNSPKDIIKLETTIGEEIISTQDFSMVTLFEIQGLRSVLSYSELIDSLETFGKSLQPYLKKEGAHAIQCVMDYNPSFALRNIKKSVDLSRNTAKNQGLDLDFIFSDQESKLSQFTSYEKVYLAIWTRPAALSPHNRKNAMKEQSKRFFKDLYSKNAQSAQSYLEELITYHQSFINGVTSGLGSARILARKLDRHEAIKEMRGQIDPEVTPDTYRPFLKGDKISLRTKNPLSHPMDAAHLMLPKISSQVVPREPEELNYQMVQIGENLHHPITVAVPPQEERTFDYLFGELINKSFPWRISFNLNGKEPIFGGKQFLSTIFKKVSTDNQLIFDALKHLESRRKNGETNITLKITLDTWVNAFEENAPKKLKAQASELMSCVLGWGNSETNDVIGNPTLGVLSTVSGLIDESPAEETGAPLNDVVKMLPLSRPSSIWDKGNTLFRTPCGKLFPYQQGSSMQAAWVDINVAPMGFGKSTNLNTLNFSFVFEAGLQNLPWLSSLDIGSSLKGMVNLIKMGLPDHQQHLAVYHRLKMHKDHAINPFDTPVGLRKPMKNHKSFLVRLLSLLGTGFDKDAPPDQVPDIASRAIDLAYNQYSDKENAKHYLEGVYDDIDKVLKKLNMPIDNETTWWEVVDFLIEKNDYHLASKAQRQAVPILREVAGLFRHHTIETLYKSTTYSGDEIIKYFWNQVTAATGAYDILQGPTQIDFSEARIISLDLEEVAPNGGGLEERQTALMYMLGRHVVASKFFLMPDDVRYIENPKVKAYHAEKIKSIRNDPKRLNMDELHRVSKPVGSSAAIRQIIADVVTAIRESRKWKLHIGLASQNIDDIPAEIRNLATSIYIYGAGSNEEVNRIGEVFSLTHEEKRIIKNINKPNSSGSTFFGIFKTSHGEIHQRLMNSLGSVTLWGFSSTWDDNRVRESVIERVGLKQGFYILAKLYPGGSVMSELEKRKTLYSSRGESSKDVVQEIIDEIVQSATQSKK